MAVTIAPKEANDLNAMEDEAFRARTLRIFFDGRRLRQIPAKRRAREVILHELAEWFKAGERYPEPEVNSIREKAVDELDKEGLSTSRTNNTKLDPDSVTRVYGVVGSSKVATTSIPRKREVKYLTGSHSRRNLEREIRRSLQSFVL